MANLSKISIFITLLALLGCSDNETNNIDNQTPATVNTEQVANSTPIPMAVNYQEGVDYRIVKNINTGDLKAPFIIEYFWLSCGHCQKLEKPLQEFKKQHPNVGFARKHAVLAERWVMDARLYYALEETNNIQHFDEFFSLYMKGMTEERFNQFFEKNNIDKDAFLKIAGNSDAILAKMKESLQEMSDNKMTSVPSIVVNGKYLIMKSDNGDYFNLVNYLLTK